MRIQSDKTDDIQGFQFGNQKKENEKRSVKVRP